VCDKQECKYIVYLWREKISIGENMLRKIYGETVKVYRTCGDMEDGWKIFGMAYRLKEGGKMWISVRNGKNVKLVSMDELDLWNKYLTV